MGLSTNTLISVVALIIGPMACTKRPAINTTDTTEVVETDKNPKSVSKDTPVSKDRKSGPKTWENSGTKIVNEGKAIRKTLPIKPVPTKPKIVKSESKKWETGSSSGHLAKSGVSPSTMDEKSVALPSPMAKKAPSLSLADSVGGFGSSSAEGKLGRAAGPTADFKSRGRKEDRSYQKSISDDILTAGSFDDADDIQVFQKFWNASELASNNINVRDVDWSRTFKKADTKKHAALQLAFVVDTTGSMGDELEYLKKEFKSIVSEISRSYPGVKKEYAFIAYRDQHDEYVTRGLNFTSDTDAVQTFIREQSANGGGDYPEAVHTALEEAYSRLDWNDDSGTARMLFHIADAPAHMHEMNHTFEAVEKLSAAGVNIFPVAASGVQDLAEAMMRATALLTGGQYIFLTDDSGVGLAHAAPKHPCYEVEKLKTIMVRVIKDRISGSRSFPIAKNVIRHGGDRSTGYCRTQKKVVGQW